jgi:XcyI-like restriction endonuclease
VSERGAIINIPAPQLQVDFALALEQTRGLYLQEALSKAVASLLVTTIDAELAGFAPASSLAELANHGLRGELMLAVPCVLRANRQRNE